MNEDYIDILTEVKKQESSTERILFLSVIFQALLDATKEIKYVRQRIRRVLDKS